MSPKFDIVAAILNNKQQPGWVFVMSLDSKDFVHMASDNPFNYLSGYSWALLFWAKHAPNSKIIALKIVKWIVTWKKK